MCKNVALEAGPLAGLQKLVHLTNPGRAENDVYGGLLL